VLLVLGLARLVRQGGFIQASRLPPAVLPALIIEDMLCRGAADATLASGMLNVVAVAVIILACRPQEAATNCHVVTSTWPCRSAIGRRQDGPSTGLPPSHLARTESTNTQPSTCTSARVQGHTLAVVKRLPPPHSDATTEGRLAVHKGRVGHLDFLHGMDGRVIWTL
jgi:hypothetical protein